MFKSTLASEMIEAVRDGLDEFNTDSIKKPQILKLLNRAQRAAVNIIARRYEDAFLEDVSYTATGTESEIYLPADCFGGRIESIDYISGGKPRPTKRISFRRSQQYESVSSDGGGVYAWCQVGRKIKLYNPLTSGQQLTIWITRSPEPIVEEQGRITDIDSVNNRITVDSIGDDVTTASSSLNNYINIIDFGTGEVKGTVQVGNISGNRLTIKTTPDRTSVFDKTILSSLPDDIEVDDYICVSRGSCITDVYEAYVDFMTEYATVNIKRSIGEDGQSDYIELNDLKDELKKLWSGRENTRRVAQKSRRWKTRYKRYYSTSS